MTDREWADMQQREMNLRSFQVQPKRTRNRGKNIPATTFEPWMLTVAIGVLEREDAA